MPTTLRAPPARSVRAARRGAPALAALCAALLLAGCAGTPRRGSPWMQAPLNASSGCYAPRPNLHAAYNRDYTVLGHRYAPLHSATGYDVDGTASWYGWESGTTTSMGSHFNPRAFTAASRVLPLPTCVEVTNLRNGRSALVLVNDRGPFVDSRVMDLSYGAAKALGVTATGTAPVRIVALAHSREQLAAVSHAAAPAPAAATPGPQPATPQAGVVAAAPPQTSFPNVPASFAASATAAAAPSQPPTLQLTPLPPLPASAASTLARQSPPSPASPPSAASTAASAAAPSGTLSAAAALLTPPPAPARGALPEASAAASAPALPGRAGTPPLASASQPQARAPLPAGAPQTYLQTGAFTIEANARQEARRLRGAGIGTVEVVPGFVRGRTWYKVQIGPLPAGGGPRITARLGALGLHSYTFVQQ